MPPKPKAGPTTSAKRARSSSRPGLGAFDEIRHDPSLPAFLRQSNAEIRHKFTELAWQQSERMSQGQTGDDPTSKWAQETTRAIKARNRYDDIKPWASSRIHLKVPEGDLDYINASPILLKCSKTGNERKYIATQGPKDSCLDQFWQMIWHETKKAAVIVMLTQLVEGPWEKCSQYFPADLENHSINVRITDEKGDDREGVVKLVETKYDEVSRTTIRQLLLTRGEHSKTIWHLFFLGWPDYGVPKDDSRDALLELIKLSRSKNESWNHPRIIHCSAGVGRSGTFIALDHLLEELDNGSMRVAKGSDDPVFDTVSTLREQRMAMVQSDLQFQIIYDLLRQEYLKTEKIQEPKTPVDEIIQTEKLPIPGGEPSPKVMRVSRGTKKVFVRDKNTRTSSDGDSNESSSIEGKAPKTP